jgi:hypothetical protein
MPAGLPGDTLFNNQGNPNAGPFVILDPLSGPKDAPFDAKSIDYSTGTPPGWDPATNTPIKVNDDSNISTGGLSTGIGFGSPPIFGPGNVFGTGSLVGFGDDNFTDDYVPGVDLPSSVAATDSTLVYIGGGRSAIEDGTGPDGNGYPPGWFTSQPDPYDELAVALCGAGNGGSRDSGANTGFGMKTVTATGAVANGAAVEAGFINRSGVALVTGQSVFGSAAVANPAPV